MNEAEARRWLRYAVSDLDAARALMSEPDRYPRQVCYLAQQAAEKALKAILVYLQIEFPFTHDLDRLREAIPAGWRVKTEFPKLYALSIWAIESLYPGDMPDVIAADALAALDTAQAIYASILADFEDNLPL